MEKTPPRKKKSKAQKSSKKTKKPKKTPASQDESSDDEVTQSDASHHSEAEPEQTEPPKKPEAGSSKTRPQTPPEKDTTFDNLGNIENLTQTPPVPPHDQENLEQTNKPSPTRSESEPVDKEIQMDQLEDELFNPNKATTSSYIPPAERFTFFPVSFEEEPFPS